MARISSDVRQYAVAGARARIQELSAEIERIRAMFPGEFGLRGGTKTGKDSAKRKRRMSAAGRKSISDAAKRRWAKERAEKEADGAAKGSKKR